MPPAKQPVCHKYGCSNLGTKSCGACGKTYYCSIECQTGDWRKFHKIWCAKNLFQYGPVNVTKINEIIFKFAEHFNVLVSEGKEWASVAAMETLITNLELVIGPRHKFDDCMAPIQYRIWLAEICIRNLEFDKALSNSLKAREMLETCGSNNEVEKSYHLRAELTLSKCYISRSRLSKARHHSGQSLAFARRYKGIEHIQRLHDSLLHHALILQEIPQLDKAQPLFEEAYNILSELYGQEHPDVQYSIVHLVENLMKMGKFSQADDYARINYETLIYGASPESYVAATAMQQLADLWDLRPLDPSEEPEKGDEAERLAKRAHEIVFKAEGRHTNKSCHFLKTVFDVAMKKGLLTTETRVNAEICLMTTIQEVGILNIVTKYSLASLRDFYRRLSDSEDVKNPDSFLLQDALNNLCVMIEDLSQFDPPSACVKAEALFYELVHDFISTGDKQQMFEHLRAATKEYERIMRVST